MQNTSEDTPIKFQWENLSEEETKKILKIVDAGRICELPTDYLLQYAAEDTDSTFLFYQEILRPVLDRFPEYDEFHQEYHMNLVEQVAIQQLHGVQLDLQKLHSCWEVWKEKRDEAVKPILTNQKVREGIETFHNCILTNYKEAEPERYKKQKETTEPVKFKKDGSISSNWERWKEKQERPREEMQAWLRWEEKRKELEESINSYWTLTEAERKKKYLFSITSKRNLQWFFYDFLRFPVLVLTKKGFPAVDAQALQGFGEIGKLFEALNEADKMLQFLNSLENASDLEPGQGVYHPSLKVPGTFTGRLSGDGGFNWQNPPKSREFLEIFAPRSGCVLVDWDATSLEPTVLAELSRDPGLLSVYGPKSSPYQDIYLLVGAAFPGIGDTFRECGYDPTNPTEDAVKRCKKEHKDLRNACKGFHLSASYGAGVKKWYILAQQNGFPYTIEQCKSFHKAYWDLFRTIKKWEESQITLWEKNGGWLLDGLGLPYCVDAFALKDLTNRCIQRTGHEVLMMYQKVVTDLFRERGIRQDRKSVV
jgi:hypothetical protein